MRSFRELPGVVSWWYPASTPVLGSMCCFEIEESPKFDADNIYHDLFRVKGTPFLPLELVDVPQAQDEEELRHILYVKASTHLLACWARWYSV